EAGTVPAAEARAARPTGGPPPAGARDGAPGHLPACGASPAGRDPGPTPAPLQDGRSREQAHCAGDRGNNGTLSTYEVPVPPDLAGSGPGVICQSLLRHSVRRLAPCRP